MVGKYCVHPKFRRQSRNFIGGTRMAHDQAAAGFAQSSVQFGNTGTDKCDTAIPARKRIENFLVKNESAVDQPALRKCVMQRGMVKIS